MNKYFYNSGTVRVWQAEIKDYNFILQLCKQYRDFEFFYVPDETLKNEIRKGNIIAFDYNVFEAGYIWVTFPKNRKSLASIGVEKILFGVNYYKEAMICCLILKLLISRELKHTLTNQAFLYL